MTVDLYLFYCIWGTGASQENFPQVPKIMNFDIQKVIQSVKPHILHQLKPYSSEKYHRRVEFLFVLNFLGHQGTLRETELKQNHNTPSHDQEDTESNLKSSTYHFTSNKSLIKCNDHQKVMFHMFQGTLENGTI